MSAQSPFPRLFDSFAFFPSGVNCGFVVVFFACLLCKSFAALEQEHVRSAKNDSPANAKFKLRGFSTIAQGRRAPHFFSGGCEGVGDKRAAARNAKQKVGLGKENNKKTSRLSSSARQASSFRRNAVTHRAQFDPASREASVRHSSVPPRPCHSTADR